MTLRLGVLASHSGTTLQAIIDACADGTIKADIAVVISNNSGSIALGRAQSAGIATAHLSSAAYPDADQLDQAILSLLRAHDVELVILAGYMKKLGPRTIAAYKNRILNIHPALLPRHGGAGLYGDRVHRAVIAAGDAESGNTIHIVDEQYDHGPTVAQAALPVLAQDTPETLGEKVVKQGHTFYVDTLRQIAAGELTLPD